MADSYDLCAAGASRLVGHLAGEHDHPALAATYGAGALAPADGRFLTMLTKTEATDPASEFVASLTRDSHDGRDLDERVLPVLVTVCQDDGRTTRQPMDDGRQTSGR